MLASASLVPSLSTLSQHRRERDPRGGERTVTRELLTQGFEAADFAVMDAGCEYHREFPLVLAPDAPPTTPKGREANPRFSWALHVVVSTGEFSLETSVPVAVLPRGG